MARRVLPAEALDAFVLQSELLIGWARTLSSDERESASVLPEWTIAHLLTHLAGSAAIVPGIAGRSAERGARPLALHEYVSTYVASASAIAAGAQTPAPAEQLALRTAEAVAAARAVSGDPVVAARCGPVRFADFLQTRVIELVVHGRDLARSLPNHPPSIDPGALRLVTRALADALAARHPGHTVELRVPPYAAVQLLEGGAHTRGTPPNVVETDPGTFVDLAAGRIAFPDALDAGAVRASGIRADLTTVFPVFR